MSAVFADTSYYLALVLSGDADHASAVRLGRTLRRPIVTTEFVLTELGNALSRSSVRAAFVRVLADLRSDPTTMIVPAGEDLFRRGCDLFRRRPDKEWSLTDCMSFEVMNELGLTEALTADHHFEQAGFAVLMK